jgi:hypothetical protein
MPKLPLSSAGPADVVPPGGVIPRVHGLPGTECDGVLTSVVVVGSPHNCRRRLAARGLGQLR